MRTRAEIENNAVRLNDSGNLQRGTMKLLILEVVLDIRDALTKDSGTGETSPRVSFIDPATWDTNEWKQMAEWVRRMVSDAMRVQHDAMEVRVREIVHTEIEGVFKAVSMEMHK